jgi:ornithine cyclodeaminase/alanine dehydrogenase-like protein (mu-crystallin family)
LDSTGLAILDLAIAIAALANAPSDVAQIEL